MKKLALFLFAAIPLIIPCTAFAQECTGVPDLDYSIVWQENSGPATLMVVPNGSGPSLTEARTPDGTVVDATVHLTIINNCGDTDPVVGFPREDMWMISIDGGLVVCTAGSIADVQTDQEGNTYWSEPLMAGGWDEGNCRIMVNGMSVGNSEGLLLHFVSPDIDGNLAVNLSDVALFVMDFFGPYSFRSDLAHDGVVNLSDVTILSGAMGNSCP